MKAAIYTRTSQDEINNPRKSNKTQEEVCRQKAEELGDNIIKVYSDIGKSGDSLNRRYEFLKMREDAKYGLFEKIYFINFERFSRKLTIQENQIEFFQKLHIQLFSVFEGRVEDKTALTRQIKGAINEEYIRGVRNRAEIEHSTRLEKGIPVTRPPIGYRINKKTKKWEIDKRRARVVQDMFNLRVRGHDLKSIAKKFKFSIPRVRHILKNKAYLGLYKYRDKYYNFHEKIISEEVFKKCQ